MTEYHVIYKCKELSINKYENKVQNTWWAHVGTGQNWKETMDIGRKEKKKRTKYSRVSKVSLWTEFGSFPPTHNKQ